MSAKRQCVRDLFDVLLESGCQDHASLISKPLLGSDNALDEFLTSNELWGGAGSIADEAGTADSKPEVRRRIEHALIRLGEEQIRSGKINVRTASWVAAFKEWSQ